MRAFICHRLSDDLSGVGVEERMMPEPGPGEVRLKVEAASVNFPDILLCQGKYQLKLEPPFVPGMDMAGIVDAVGSGVSELAVGDAVAGGARFGGFAEYAIARADALQAKPETMSFSEAAAYPAAYLTAYVALVRRANLQAGETLLVHGATGGVGLAAVDVGKLLGATVIATSASDDKLDKVVDYGADYALNVTQGFKTRVKSLTGGCGADVIFDPVGGDVFDESVRCIGFGGRLCVIGFTSGRIATLPTNMALIKGFSLVGVRAGEYGRKFPDKGRENVKQIWQWAREGKTRPRVHAEYKLEDTRRAFDELRNRTVVGKVIITPNR